MSVRTSTFGGIRLTNKDAAKFREAIAAPKPNDFAKAALARGRKMSADADEHGRVIVRVTRQE